MTVAHQSPRGLSDTQHLPFANDVRNTRIPPAQSGNATADDGASAVDETSFQNSGCNSLGDDRWDFNVGHVPEVRTEFAGMDHQERPHANGDNITPLCRFYCRQYPDYLRQMAWDRFIRRQQPDDPGAINLMMDSQKYTWYVNNPQNTSKPPQISPDKNRLPLITSRCLNTTGFSHEDPRNVKHDISDKTYIMNDHVINPWKGSHVTTNYMNFQRRVPLRSKKQDVGRSKTMLYHKSREVSVDDLEKLAGSCKISRNATKIGSYKSRQTEDMISQYSPSSSNAVQNNLSSSLNSSFQYYNVKFAHYSLPHRGTMPPRMMKLSGLHRHKSNMRRFEDRLNELSEARPLLISQPRAAPDSNHVVGYGRTPKWVENEASTTSDESQLTVRRKELLQPFTSVVSDDKRQYSSVAVIAPPTSRGSESWSPCEPIIANESDRVIDLENYAVAASEKDACGNVISEPDGQNKAIKPVDDDVRNVSAENDVTQRLNNNVGDENNVTQPADYRASNDNDENKVTKPVDDGVRNVSYENDVTQPVDEDVCNVNDENNVAEKLDDGVSNVSNKNDVTQPVENGVLNVSAENDVKQPVDNGVRDVIDCDEYVDGRGTRENNGFHRVQENMLTDKSDGHSIADSYSSVIDMYSDDSECDELTHLVIENDGKSETSVSALTSGINHDASKPEADSEVTDSVIENGAENKTASGAAIVSNDGDIFVENHHGIQSESTRQIVRINPNFLAPSATVFERTHTIQESVDEDGVLIPGIRMICATPLPPDYDD